MRSLLLLPALLFSALVQAAPVTWELNGVAFDDGTSVSGWFIYDADSGSLQDFSISVENAPPPPCVNCSDTGIYPSFESLTYTPDIYSFEFFDHNYGGFDLTNPYDCFILGCAQILNLGFADYLTDAGGVVQLQTLGCDRPCTISYEDVVWSPTGAGVYISTRYVVSGNVSAVPIPAAVWLFGSGLGLLGWMRRKVTV